MEVHFDLHHVGLVSVTLTSNIRKWAVILLIL